jgi:homocysteine S-methyltransferase
MFLVDAFAKVRARGAIMVGVNCMTGPHGMARLLKRVPEEYVFAAYPNAGTPKCHQGRLIYPTTPDDFAKSAREMAAAGARLVGGCCGTNPNHIVAIAAAIGN